MAALTILVAEEEPLNAMALEAQALALGHRVVGPAATGAEAVGLAEAYTIDLAILDLSMGGRAALGTAERIFRIRPVPIVVLTDYGDSEAAHRAACAPVFHHLVKPVSTEELMPAISVARRRFMEWTELRTEVADLERRLGEHKVIERAKGLIMEQHGVSADRACRVLEEESERRGESATEIARTIIAADALLRGTLGV